MTVKIVEVSATPVVVPLLPGRESISAAYSVSGKTYSSVLVTITADDGTKGYAEASLRPYVYGDSLPGLTYMIGSVLGAKLIGRDPQDVMALRQEMDVPTGVTGNIVAKGALDIALHDLLARHRGTPLYEMLGGYQSGDPKVHCTWLLPMHDIGRVVDEATEAFSNGYRAFKIKVGRPAPDTDVELIRRLREALGSDALLYADANEGYAPADARRVLPRMADHGLAWIEDPCPIDLPREVRVGLAAAIPIPVLGDASCFTPRDALRELRDGTSTMVMVKLPRTGYLGARSILEICKAFGVHCILGTQGEAELGTVAAGHLALSHRGIFRFTELSFFTRMQSSITPDVIKAEHGCFRLPSGSGLAVTPDASLVRKFTVGSPITSAAKS